jgi:hypothetical protein
MGFNSKLGAAALGVLIMSLAGPALAGEQKVEKNFTAEKVEKNLAAEKKVERPNITVNGGLGTTNSGGTAACPTHIVCIVNGVIINGPGMEACNNGYVTVISQCMSKAKL